MSQKRAKELCAGDCGIPELERNRYFTGKYMTERDFAGEQEYFQNRRRLHNRLLHGWGIVCGLRVLEHPSSDNFECREKWVVVKAGVAFDCCGREIFLTDDTPIEVPLDQLSWPQKSPPQEPSGDEKCSDGEGEILLEPGPNNGLLLCLSYQEELIEPVPALYSEGSCDPAHHEANRVREVACLEFHCLDEMEPGCWRIPSGSWVDPCKDDCNKPLPGPAGACLTPDCPCQGCIPLALLTPVPEPESGSPYFMIDLRGRRHLPTPSNYLTHIVGINWPHGGKVNLHEFLDDMGSELRIRFDRKLLSADGIATGVNRRTFTVEFGGITRHLEALPSPENDEPRLDEDECTAVYPIAPEYLRGRDTIAGSYVYVTLRCDFMLDCHEMPVDGNHLHGRLPSGDGRPGGEFVSWFRVMQNHGHEEEER
jgi:hypothetical protein